MDKALIFLLLVIHILESMLTENCMVKVSINGLQESPILANSSRVKSKVMVNGDHL